VQEDERFHSKEERYRGLLLAATFSGVCGLSYEVLYTRILATYFGSIFYVAAAVIGGFLAGIGITALYAHRFSRWRGINQGALRALSSATPRDCRH